MEAPLEPLRTAGASMFVPALVFAHAFAALFLARSLAALAPDKWRRFKHAVLLALHRSTERDAGAALPRPASCDLRKELQLRAGPTLLLEWEGLGCSYNTPSGFKAVLQDVSGAARPYEMLALMGPSGAGKSTLLDILAGRKSVGRLSGAVLVNGAPRGASFARHAAYVPQEDSFLPTMTVGETCALHAALTLPRGTGRAAADERIGEVLAAMGMLHARDTLVGGVLPGGLSLRGLSGGERKRVSIAVGILAAPSVLFLDEPTSGLDSCAALSVVEHLRERARDLGLTVVASIHQPRAHVWACFDACAMLSGGLLLYTGPCGGVVGWFESIGLGPWRPDVHGTACDWIIDVVNLGFSDKPQLGGSKTIGSSEELADAARRFAEHYRAQRKQLAPPASTHGSASKQQQQKQQQQQLARAASGADSVSSRDQAAGPRPHPLVVGPGAGDAGTSSGGASPSASSSGGSGARGQRFDLAVDVESATPLGSVLGACSSGGSSIGGVKRRRPSWLTQFRALFWREMLGAVRNPADVAGRMLLFAWMGTVCGLVFWRAGDAGGVDGVRSRTNLLFLLAVQLLLMPYVYLSLYAADKRHYTADMSARLYRPSAYYAAKTTAVLPFILANVLVCTFIAYGMSGLRLSLASVATVGTASALLYLIAQQLQSMATILMPNEDSSFLLSIVWSALNIYMSNFLIRFEDMAFGWLSQLRWLSALNYAFSAFAAAELSGSFSCEAGLVSGDVISLAQRMLPGTPQLRSKAVERMLKAPGPDCVVQMDAALDYYGMTSPAWVYLLALLAYLIVVHAASFAGLLLLARKERR